MGRSKVPDSALMKELGRELRRARLDAGYRRQLDLAGILRLDRSAVSRAENGTRIPTDDVLKRWCEACGVDFAKLAARAHGARGSVPEWFEGWARDVETRSVRLGYWNPIIVPAILRTEGYVRGVLGAGGVAPASTAVAAQLARASVIDHAEVTAVIHEMTLRRFVASPEVMADQFRHLASVADRPSVHLHVVPNNCTSPGMSGALSIAHDLAVVHLDGLRGRTTDDPAVFRDATIVFERIRDHALPRGASQDFIAKVAREQ